MESRQDPGYRALRRGRASVSGQIYCLTTVTARRQPILADLWAARVVVNAMRDLHEQHCVTSLAFVVMPDHLHWLVELGPLALDRLMQLLKTRSARRIRPLCDGIDTVWQKGFHDRAARREENAVALARYIVMNPVRAGLVRSVRDYPFWDCVWIENKIADLE
jgi:putative transposase